MEVPELPVCRVWRGTKLKCRPCELTYILHESAGSTHHVLRSFSGIESLGQKAEIITPHDLFSLENKYFGYQVMRS